MISSKNHLPKGWRLVQLGDITHISTGGTPSTIHPEYYGGTIRWLTSGDVKGTYIYDVPHRITQQGLDNSNAKLHPPGSVMLAMSGQGKTRGTSAILMVPSACSQSVAAILPTDEALPEIIHFALVNLYDDIRRITGDNERTGLNLKIIGKIEIPLPPLDEQKRIAKILNEQMTAVEKARAAAESRLAAAKALPAAYLRQVFPKPGYELPDGWKWVRLGETCKQDKQIYDCNHEQLNKLTYIGLENVESNTGRIVLNPALKATDAGTTFVFDSRHILYSKLRPYLNKVAIPNFKGRCTTELIPLLVEKGINREFIAWILKREDTVEAVMKEKTGSRMPRADMDVLLSIVFSLPAALIEQERIALLLNEKMAKVDNIMQNIQKEIESINILPAVFLQRFFTGGL